MRRPRVGVPICVLQFNEEKNTQLMCGLHWDCILCVCAVRINTGIQQQEGIPGHVDGASSQTVGPFLVYSAALCNFHPHRFQGIPSYQ